MNQKELVIIETAIQLFAAEGVSVATSKIANEAGISNGTLFNYFNTKQTLIDNTYVFIKNKISRDILGEINIEDDIRIVLEQVWNKYIMWALQFPDERRVIELLKSSQLLSEETINEAEQAWGPLIEAIEKATTKNLIVAAPVNFLTSIASGNLSSTIDYIERSKFSKKLWQDVIDLSFQTYWRGIQPNLN